MGWQVSFALGSSGFLSVFSASASWAMVSGLSGPAVVGVEAPPPAQVVDEEAPAEQY